MQTTKEEPAGAAMAPVKDGEPPLHILFFPFLIPGHLIPMADMAALFAGRGVRCTILTTPFQASIIRSVVDRANKDNPTSPSIDISVVPFPDVGLPPGAESGTGLASQDERDMFNQAVRLLREPLERSLADHRADLDAVVSDSLFHWSVDVAAEHGVPRLGFTGSSMFACSCFHSMLRNCNPSDLDNLQSPSSSSTDGESDPEAVMVALPGLPHRVEMRRSQMMKRPEEWAFFRGVDATEQRSYGELFNSFCELEPDYVKHYRTTLGRRAWLVGPVSLASGSMGVASRGTDALSPEADGCLQWLDGKPAGSVVYVAFGTLATFSPEQLQELARGLDLSGSNFVWVISATGATTSSNDWMAEGLATASRGYIIRGWAPQVLILNHPAVGCFVTHCGWNSTLEALSAGVPMVTWPRHADQFHNEKLVVELLGAGVSVGAKDYASLTEAHAVIAGSVIAESVRRVMGAQGDAIQKKARDLSARARDAVENGGSSYGDVGRLMDELVNRRIQRHDAR
ncbi:anthocyanin 3'-O-beta-glucosyltransferase-like [Triticum urartu]|nr:anthocyanin 3'-O-beta-glucosyltransferase-like [Triticum urartu]